jgi:hypothetical protein
MLKIELKQGVRWKYFGKTIIKFDWVSYTLVGPHENLQNIVIVFGVWIQCIFTNPLVGRTIINYLW